MLHVRAKRAVGAVFFAFGTDIGAWASRIPDFKQALGLAEGPFGLVLLSVALGAMCGFPVAGFLVDRFGAARAAKAFLALLLVAFGLLPWGVAHVAIFVVLLLLLGVVIGSLDVAMNAWGAEVEKAHAKPLMNSYHGLYSLGSVAGAGAGAITLWLDWSVQLHYVSWVFLLLIPAIFAWKTPWDSERSAVKGARPPVVAFPKGALVLVGLMCLAGGLGEGAVTDWAALYQIQELHYDESLAAMTFAIYSCAMMAMRFSGDRIVLRYGPVKVARICGVASVIGCLLIVWAPHLSVLWIGAVVMGIGNAPLFPLSISRAAADQTMPKGAAIASVVTLGYGAFLFGPPLLGFIGEHSSLRVAFLFVAVAALAIVLFARSFEVEDRQADGG